MNIPKQDQTLLISLDDGSECETVCPLWHTGGKYELLVGIIKENGIPVGVLVAKETKVIDVRAELIDKNVTINDALDSGKLN